MRYRKEKRGGKTPAAQPVRTPRPFVVDRETFEQMILDSDVRGQDERILAILGVEDEDGAAGVNYENMGKFLDHLEKEMTLPVLVTGVASMGCFAWEEYYTFGPGSKADRKKLKKTRPSYTDEYELLSLEDSFDEVGGLHGNVRRISDRKRFTLPLADLKAVDQKSKNARLLKDYASWRVNFR